MAVGIRVLLAFEIAALLMPYSKSGRALAASESAESPLKPNSVRSQLKPIAYVVMNSPGNQYVHVALGGSANLSYAYRRSSANSSLLLMKWYLMPFNRPIPKNDARYHETSRWHASTAITTLRLTKINETILGQSFKAVAFVTPKTLTTISGIVHFVKEKAYTLTAVQERQLNGKIRLKVTVAQGNLPVSLTLWDSTSKKLLMKVASRPDVYVTMPAIDSLKHSNESQFTIVAENAVRIDKVKANVILRNFGPSLGCQVFDLVEFNSTLVYVECGFYSYPISTGELTCAGVNSNVFRLRKTLSQQNHWLHSMFPVYLQFVAESANIGMCGNVFLDCELKAKNGWESKVHYTRLNFRLPCEDASLPTSTASDMPAEIPSTITPNICTPALCPVQDRPNLTTPAVSYATFDGQDVNESADVALIASDASNITLTVAFKDGRTVSFQKRIQVITADESPTVSYQTNQTYQTALIVVTLTFFGLTCAVFLYLIYIRCITKKKNCSTPQPQSDNSHAVVESECTHVNPSYLSSQGASVA